MYINRKKDKTRRGTISIVKISWSVIASRVDFPRVHYMQMHSDIRALFFNLLTLVRMHKRSFTSRTFDCVHVESDKKIYNQEARKWNLQNFYITAPLLLWKCKLREIFWNVEKRSQGFRYCFTFSLHRPSRGNHDFFFSTRSR